MIFFFKYLFHFFLFCFLNFSFYVSSHSDQTVSAVIICVCANLLFPVFYIFEYVSNLCSFLYEFVFFFNVFFVVSSTYFVCFRFEKDQQRYFVRDRLGFG